MDHVEHIRASENPGVAQTFTARTDGHHDVDVKIRPSEVFDIFSRMNDSGFLASLPARASAIPRVLIALASCRRASPAARNYWLIDLPFPEDLAPTCGLRTRAVQAAFEYLLDRGVLQRAPLPGRVVRLYGHPTDAPTPGHEEREEPNLFRPGVRDLSTGGTSSESPLEHTPAHTRALFDMREARLAHTRALCEAHTRAPAPEWPSPPPLSPPHTPPLNLPTPPAAAEFSGLPQFTAAADFLAANLAELVRAGIAEPAASRLAADPAARPEIIRTICRRDRERGKGPGAMVLNLRTEFNRQHNVIKPASAPGLVPPPRRVLSADETRMRYQELEAQRAALRATWPKLNKPQGVNPCSTS
jgi:hypothetical protein